jgi:hypothetical protein
MRFFELHQLNSPDRIVLIDRTRHFNVAEGPAGSGSVLTFSDNSEVVYAHESPETIAYFLEG